MKTLSKVSLTLLLLLLCLSSAVGQIKLGSPFTDHMVLQRGMLVPVWGFAAPGEKVTVTINKLNQTTQTGSDGKWNVNFRNLKTGGPYEMVVSGNNTITLTDVYVGEVWLCSGQSNMDMTVAKEDRYWCGVFNEAQEVASANYPLIRQFYATYSPNLLPQNQVSGEWEVCSPATVGHFRAAAYFFARNLYQKMNVPIGLLVTTFGASTAEAWTSRPALEANPNLKFLLDNFKLKLDKFYTDSARIMASYRDETLKYREAVAKAKAESINGQATQSSAAPRRGPSNPRPWVDQHNPTVLYNGMVAPLIPYAIRGAIWYQGESNGPTAKQYRNIMETMIADWRKAWDQGNFPFIYVQIANHQDLIKEPVKDDPMVYVREGQLQNLSIPNTAMVSAIDNADPNEPGNIHPKNKQEIGLRLSVAARALVYKEKLTYMGPVYNKMNVEGNTIRVKFSSTGQGLVAKGDNVTGFAIAGDDKKFVWANAKIDRTSVIVSSPDVPNPKSVRYGWSKNPPVNLYNKEGFPTSPFRTDNW
jgi:sialate O-acetylesterase